VPRPFGFAHGQALVSRFVRDTAGTLTLKTTKRNQGPHPVAKNATRMGHPHRFLFACHPERSICFDLRSRCAVEGHLRGEHDHLRATAFSECSLNGEDSLKCRCSAIRNARSFDSAERFASESFCFAQDDNGKRRKFCLLHIIPKARAFTSGARDLARSSTAPEHPDETIPASSPFDSFRLRRQSLRAGSPRLKNRRVSG
jgi:hypothetical protein